MLTRAKALPRRLLHGGAAGDAGLAQGRHIASNVVVQLVARAISMAISVITVSLTARTLDPEGFGVWSGSLAFVGLFATLTDLGFTTAAMQRMAADPEREHAWLGALAVARGGLSLVAGAVCAVAIPLLLGGGHDAHVVAWIMTATVLTSGANALMSVFHSRLRAGVALSFSVLHSALWLTAVVVLAVVDASVVAFAAAYVGILCVIAALQLRTTRRLADIAWREGLRLWRPLLRIAFPLGIAGVLITVYYQVDSVLLLSIAGPEEAGIYGAAYRVIEPLTFLPAAVMASFFPVLSAVRARDPARVNRLVQVAADYMLIISLPVLAATVALSGPIVDLLYGPGYDRAAGLLPILMLAFVFICLGTLSGFLAPLVDLQWRLALYSAIGAAANVGLNLLLIPPHGAYGSAWATVATELLTMTLMLSTSLRRLRLRLVPWRILRTLVVAAAAGAAMAAAGELGLVPGLVAGAVVYPAGLLALRVVRVEELRSLRRQKEELA
jgi:O-antigen/teichoic acid export membrane protein